MNQAEYAAYDLKTWAELQGLADAGDIAGFYQLYAKYLEKSGMISSGRKLLHRMAIEAAEALARKETE